jgi:hypothetical protein
MSTILALGPPIIAFQKPLMPLGRNARLGRAATRGIVSGLVWL